MERSTRRDFLADVGKGMLVASVGSTLAADLGLSTALADSATRRLEFGRLEPLVDLLQDSGADQMLPLVVNRVRRGTDLRDLVAAAALANARTFGGEDYVGFHAFMALAPAWHMSHEMPADRRALPVLKVLYRSTKQIETKGGRANEVLHPVQPSAPSQGRAELHQAMRNRQMDRAESLFASMVSRSAQDAYNDLQSLVEDETDVHRVVLAYRAWDLLGLTGKEHAHTTLRQSVRYCVKAETDRVARGYPESGIRVALPRIIDQYRLAGRGFGSREGDDAWVRSLCNTLLYSTPEQAAEAVGAAIAEGFSAASIGEALSLGATQQVLRDPGRKAALPLKPIGSVHGDSVGVHASDSMNAWRNMAKVSNPQNAVAGLIVGGYHLATPRGYDWQKLPTYPLGEQRDEPMPQEPPAILAQIDSAIRENNQARAAALAQRYGQRGGASRPLFDLLLRYATSEDGALHAEKYYRTVTEEFGRTRPAFRWEHVVALARVTASEFGKRADGYELACDLLKVKA